MTLRTSVLALLALAACRVAEAPAEPPAAAPVASVEPSAPADTTQTRAEAAGLTEAQEAELGALGVPVYVLALPPGWTLTTLTSAAPVYGDALYPEYTLRYRTPRGGCLVVLGASEGLGGVFAQPPPNIRDVHTGALGVSPAVRVGWSATDDTTEGWSGGRVATEWFEADGYWLSVQSADGCPVPTPTEVDILLTSLHPLDPADDALLIGPVDVVDAVGDADRPAGRDPEALALAVFGPREAGEGQQTAVETLRRRGAFAVVLVTTTDLADDSVRDVRTRVALVRRGAGWEIVSAGAQRRCQAGRGAQTWSASACR